MSNLDLKMRARQRMPVKEYESLTEVERAVSDARHYFAVIIGEEHMAGDGSRRTHSLYQLKGPEVERIRSDLYRALVRNRIRYEDSPDRHLAALKKTAETAIVDVGQIKETSTNGERLRNVAAMLEEVVAFCAEAEAAAAAARSAAAAELAARWPEDRSRGQEIRHWGDALALALDVIENISGEAPGTEWWNLSPGGLAELPGELEDSHPEIDLGGAVASLRSNDLEAAWIGLLRFVGARKSGAGN